MKVKSIKMNDLKELTEKLLGGEDIKQKKSKRPLSQERLDKILKELERQLK